MQTKNPSVVLGAVNEAREKPALVEAIDLTLRTIERRARLYRNVLVAVAVVSVGSLLAALIGWRAWPLAGLVLIVPLAGGFLFLDCRRVRLWHETILGMCGTRGLDSTVFLQTVAQFKHVPAGSLQGMLAMLSPNREPVGTTIQDTEASEHSSRKALQTQEWRILTSTIVLTLGFASAAAAALEHSVWLLLLAAGWTVLLVFLRRK